MKRPVLLIATTSAALAISLGVLFLPTPNIPTTIADEEYGVYSDWTISHFSKNPPQGLFLLSRTFKFDPFEQPSGCSDTMIQKDGVARSLLRQLHELGDAEFLLKDNSAVGLQIPWKYKFTDSSPDLPPGTFHLLAFSRVAFSRDRRHALFAVSDACAGGDCGKGGAVYALKSNGTWKFEPTGCVWMY